MNTAVLRSSFALQQCLSLNEFVKFFHTNFVAIQTGRAYNLFALKKGPAGGPRIRGQ